ncbi:MAG: acyltransferase [Eubacteriales bacterium]|nr:acyltransferase [Eubacteriales bacterium]
MNLIRKMLMYLNREVPTDTLVKRGLKVGNNFNRQQGVYIDPTHCYLIEIGNDVTISIRAVLMAHDASTKKLLGYTKLGRIKIEDHVFIGANATILPGVTIGEYAVIGAGSVVTKDVPARTVAAGCPAKVLCTTEEYTLRQKAQMRDGENVFDGTFVMGKGLNAEKVRKLQEQTRDGIAFIE